MNVMLYVLFFFFFQAEDGIRDLYVTGVQTCALPISGYPPDRVSPSGQLEPPNGADFPTAGSHVSKLKPPTEAVLPFVELPRPLQESGVIGKGGAAGFLGKAYDPYRLYQDPAKPIKTEDLSLRKEVPP